MSVVTSASQLIPGNPSSPIGHPDRKALRPIREEVIKRIGGEVGDEPLAHNEATRADVRTRAAAALTSILCASPEVVLTDSQRDSIIYDAVNELAGFGPIQPLLDDPTVTEVMVNGPHKVYVERQGRSKKTEITFDDDAHIERLIHRIITPLGRTIDANQPLVDARLPDGSRVNAVIYPVAIDGPSITIRKFGSTRLTVTDLVAFGALTAPLAQFLEACVLSRLNIVVTGGTGSGKTTLLNVLSGFIPEHERIITIEDAAELKMHQEHVVRMESKKKNIDGDGEVTIRDLVRNSLRMRPERIIVGECRGGEALDMLQAMNTGHDGSLTTIHANNPRDAVSRIETLALMAGIDFPIRVVREQMSSAIQLLVHVSRLRDGSRKITHITEMAGMEGERVVMQDVFRFVDEGVDAQNKVVGQFCASGLRPQFMHRIEAVGIKLPHELFARTGNVPLKR